jgi:phage gpG-like protein
LAGALQGRVQQKLAGTVLNARTGALARAITTTIDDMSGGVSIGVAAADSKYAAIHEFGGTIPPHQIVPDKAKALAFLVCGKPAFAMRVNLPAITMPERSYLRSSLAEMADELKAGLGEAIAESLS